MKGDKSIKYKQVLKQQLKKGSISKYIYYKELKWVKNFQKTSINN